VLIWINGPFGGGKTQTAYELRRRVEGAVVCDPEEVGFGLHRMTPPALRGDFQDLRAWRQGVVEVLELALAGHQGPVIAPMTLTDPAYFDEIVGTLRGRGHEVHHFALLAPREVVVDRLRERGLGFGLRLDSWAVAKVDECLEALFDPRFAIHVDTAARSVSAVADLIAVESALPIAADTDRPWRGRARRAVVGLRHLRLP
jgi:hypothetical protein